MPFTGMASFTSFATQDCPLLFMTTLPISKGTSSWGISWQVLSDGKSSLICLALITSVRRISAIHLGQFGAVATFLHASNKISLDIFKHDWSIFLSNRGKKGIEFYRLLYVRYFVLFIKKFTPLSFLKIYRKIKIS